MVRSRKRDKWLEFHTTVLKSRVVCSTTCVYYHRCPLAVYKDVSQDKPCEVVKLNDQDRERFMSLFVFGDEGLKDEAFRMLFKLARMLPMDDPRGVEKYLDLLLRVVRAFRTDLAKETGPGEPITVNISGLDVGELTDNPKEKLFLAEDVVVQTDPESLLTSPVVDKIGKIPTKESKKPVFVNK